MTITTNEGGERMKELRLTVDGQLDIPATLVGQSLMHRAVHITTPFNAELLVVSEGKLREFRLWDPKTDIEKTWRGDVLGYKIKGENGRVSIMLSAEEDLCSIWFPKRELEISYDRQRDELTIEGIRYSADMFRDLGWRSEPGTCFRIKERSDDDRGRLLMLEKCRCEQQIADARDTKEVIMKLIEKLDLSAIPGDAEGFVLETEMRVSAEMYARIQDAWASATKGTALQGKPLIVVDPGLKLKRIDASALAQRVENAEARIAELADARPALPDPSDRWRRRRASRPQPLPKPEFSEP